MRAAYHTHKHYLRGLGRMVNLTFSPIIALVLWFALAIMPGLIR
jgi:hypothetical protein